MSLIKRVEWTPPGSKRLREYVLVKLIELRNCDVIDIWIEEIDGKWVYVITPRQGEENATRRKAVP